MVTFSKQSLPTHAEIITIVSYVASSAIFINSIVPKSVQDYFFYGFQRLYRRLSSNLVVVIKESDGLTANHIFEAAYTYLGTKVSPLTTRVRVDMPEEDGDLAFTVDKNEEIVDVFKDSSGSGVSIKFTWFLQSETLVQTSSKSTLGNSRTELLYFELSFPKKHIDIALKSYLPYIVREAKKMKERKKVVKLHMVDYNGRDYWGSVALNHPATFLSMAMDPAIKQKLIDDLDRFISRKEYYRRVGKAWKRGYLFYGPPGTGKSSLVAAMANYLKFDVYDLDLREVQCNSDLRRLLLGTSNRSIVVIEDIDCNVGLQNRDSGSEMAEDDKITLSGLLNFIDGLWSSSGDERIIICTTNHKDRLDSALLRPGRMDVSIEMSYCSFSGFKNLAFNYLLIEEHRLFPVVEELLLTVQATPAEIAGELMMYDHADTALQGLVEYLQNKKVG